MVVSVHDDVVLIRDVTLIRRLFSSYTKVGEEKGVKGEDPTPFPTRRDPSLEQTNRLDSSSKTWDGRRKKDETFVSIASSGLEKRGSTGIRL